ncbi:hypothetical protein K2173_020547 [Erythroxylum novogranatense]|uniref:Uncharacterized protein n=1 Tax=Erythroxylum novogranatense TaxID=1862640 RepID=A0AAV8TGN6_9ROSI|nr:hypothetical protein K2173_020547 [Erythroxylum novogranatense]
MHLWPSMRIRDSFKISYLKKLEWNLQRMDSEKRSQRNGDHSERLLNENCDQQQQNGVGGGTTSTDPPTLKTHSLGKSVSILGELLMILSCCYCCFCCGACTEDDD